MSYDPHLNTRLDRAVASIDGLAKAVSNGSGIEAAIAKDLSMAIGDLVEAIRDPEQPDAQVSLNQATVAIARANYDGLTDVAGALERGLGDIAAALRGLDK